MQTLREVVLQGYILPPLNAIKTNVITNIDDYLESITNRGVVFVYRASWSSTMLLMFPEQLVLVPLMNVLEKSWKRKVEEMRFYVDRSNLVYVIE